MTQWALWWEFVPGTWVGCQSEVTTQGVEDEVEEGAPPNKVPHVRPLDRLDGTSRIASSPSLKVDWLWFGGDILWSSYTSVCVSMGFQMPVALS